ncbi:glycosyltransferase family 32 protein [Bermanella sp. WJH001]|uniref:glycosyltransferase family 32 protein n=1 Tax=Bermanella sp. WJH001 TaxID=3048005 RepID=UPI0024BDC545|nr:glycosyltransferase [Bermanella sp. WJH001]MDJ1537330.1 glycosyltransferase [Bermanella sp. WJH001]
MIPKNIHYCWFGGNPLPENLKYYIETWKKFCPDYEIKEWNESTFDVNSNEFTKTAYEQKKWAYVSDYVRAYALYHEGGIYLDTDVELKANIDQFLQCEAFTGFESKGSPFTALWAAIPKHSLTEKVLSYYKGRVYSLAQETNTASVGRILIEDFGINAESNTMQIGSDNKNRIHVYPAEYFCLDLLPNFATHHFEGSWVENKQPFKEYYHAKYHLTQAIEISGENFQMLNQLAKNISAKGLVKVFVYKLYHYMPEFIKTFVRKAR